MTHLVFVALAAAALAVAVVNVAFLRRRPVTRVVALVVSSVLDGAAAVDDRAWWLAGLFLVMFAWALAHLAAMASRRKP